MAIELKLKGIKAVVFDVFGPLVEIKKKSCLCAQLLDLLEIFGQAPTPADKATVMSNNVGLVGTACLFGVEVPTELIAKLELDYSRSECLSLPTSMLPQP